MSRNRGPRVSRARFAIVVERGTKHARVANMSGSDRRSGMRGVLVVLDWVGEAALTGGQGLVMTKQRVFIPTRRESPWFSKIGGHYSETEERKEGG